MNLFVFPQIENAVKGIGTDQNVLFVLIKKIILVIKQAGFICYPLALCIFNREYIYLANKQSIKTCFGVVLSVK